jgi:ABC-type dipeptide/oligopeptide/nickel transport system permease component
VGQYLVRRVLQSILVILGVTAVSFGVLFLNGDPATALLGDQNVSPAVVAQFRRDLGFDQPWYIQYGIFLGRLVRGDLGKSLYQGVSNVLLIKETLPATVELAMTATALSVSIGIPIGILSAYKRNSAADRMSMGAALAAQSMPAFWLGLMLLLIFAAGLRWLPVSGGGDVPHLILPAVTLAMVSTARNARMVRSSMLDVLSQDYIRTARSKGLAERPVLYVHGLRNALLPVVTLIGLDLGFILGGTVVVETIFAWPGMGRMIIQAINTKDLPLVQACVIVLALIFVAINLIVDLLYKYLDPRVRYG